MSTFDLGDPPRAHAPRLPQATEEEQSLVDAQYTLYLAERKRNGLGWLPGRDPALIAAVNAEVEAAQVEVDAAREVLRIAAGE